MRTSKFLILAAAFLMLALTVPTSAQAMDDPARVVAVEQGKAEAATLLQQGDAAGAYALYMRLLRMAPDDDEVNLGLARSATAAKRWNQAVMAYEMLLERHPHEAALYGELAHVYMLLGEREAAERSLAMMRSLDGTSKEDTDQALDTLESRYSNWQIHGKVRAGVQYDSNVNSGPGSNKLNLGIWQVDLDNAKSKESFGAYVGADLDMGKRFYRDSSWWFVSDVQAFWRGHAERALHDTRSRESQWGRAAVGLRHLSSSTLSEMRFKYEIFDYEFYQQVQAFGPEGTLLWAATPSFQLIVKGALDKRDYSRDRYRDGVYGWAGLYGRVFFGEDNHEVLIGGRYLGADARKHDYGYNGWESSARVVFKLPCNFELIPSISYTQEYYNGPATALEADDRRDERLMTGLGLVYHINESWALELGYQYTNNYSNSELYKHDRHFINTGVVWSF
jgi:tetratricopeptide (TPR) repeat protein